METLHFRGISNRRCPSPTGGGCCGPNNGRCRQAGRHSHGSDGARYHEPRAGANPVWEESAPCRGENGGGFSPPPKILSLCPGVVFVGGGDPAKKIPGETAG